MAHKGLHVGLVDFEHHMSLPCPILFRCQAESMQNIANRLVHMYSVLSPPLALCIVPHSPSKYTEFSATKVSISCRPTLAMYTTHSPHHSLDRVGDALYMSLYLVPELGVLSSAEMVSWERDKSSGPEEGARCAAEGSRFVSLGSVATRRPEVVGR